MLAVIIREIKCRHHDSAEHTATMQVTFQLNWKADFTQYTVYFWHYFFFFPVKTSSDQSTILTQASDYVSNRQMNFCSMKFETIKYFHQINIQPVIWNISILVIYVLAQWHWIKRIVFANMPRNTNLQTHSLLSRYNYKKNDNKTILK